MTRKEELLSELNDIKSKELQSELDKSYQLAGSADTVEKIQDAKAERYERQQSAKSHRWIMFGDFSIKFFIAFAVSGAFMYIVHAGSIASVDEELIGGTSKTSSLFNLLSVVGPLFGMVLQYYFGKNKAGANGE